MRRTIAVIALVLPLLCSCRTISSIIHDDEVVAKVGGEKLYLSELLAYIPGYATPEDSTRLAQNYINSWASSRLFEELASDQLSEKEMDVTAELESYRRSLLKYRYEQRYVNDRLDTLVTADQIKAYYNQHPDLFQLERPVLKFRFVSVMKDAPEREAVLKTIRKAEPDSTVLSSSLRYLDSGDRWTDAVVLAKEFGEDYRTMLGRLKDNVIKQDADGLPDTRLAYVVEIKRSGLAPLEFCENRIKDIILNSRKHALVQSLERDLLEDALERKHFVITRK